MPLVGLILSYNPKNRFPQWNFLKKNLVVVYFSAIFARKIIAKCVLK